MRCSGTQSELQARFGIGYRLIVRAPGPAEDLDPIVATHAPPEAPEALVKGRAAGTEVHYHLPHGTRISSLLRELLATPSVTGCEVSLQTLEDVFIKVCEGRLPAAPPESAAAAALSRPAGGLTEAPPLLATGRTLFSRQVEALARKSTLGLAHNGWLTAGRVLIPLGAALVALALLRGQSPSVCVRPLLEAPIRVDSLLTGGNGSVVVCGTDSGAAVGEALLERGSSWSSLGCGGCSDAQFVGALEQLRNALPPALELGGCVSSGTSSAVAVNSLEFTLPIAALTNLAQNALLLQRPSSATPMILNVSVHRFDGATDTVLLEPINASVIVAMAVLVLGFTVHAFLAGLSAMLERTSGEKGMLLESGASVGATWAMQLACDLALSAPLCAAAALILWSGVGQTAAAAPHILLTEPGWAFLSLLAFSFAATTATYAALQVASKPALLLLCLLAVALLHPFVVFLVTYLAIVGTQGTAFAGARVVAALCSAQTPASALVVALMTISNTAQMRCQPADLALAPLAPAMAVPLGCLGAQGLAFLGAALVADWLPAWRARWAGRVGGAAAAAGLVLSGLRKSFGATVAVQDVSLAVPRGDCVALLGENGCGKTTLLAMIGGLIAFDGGGDCTIDGSSVVSSMAVARRKLAVCPHFDALPAHLSVRETIAFFARMKGLPEHNIATAVDGLISELGLQLHCDQLTGALSGGNRRKTSLAAALVGRAPCLLLDEATTGMDALSKRVVWRALATRRGTQAVLMTTHSLEEAEAVASHIAIMSAGRLQAQGTLPQLRSQFEGGYTVDLVLGESAVTDPASALRDMPGVASLSAPAPDLHPERLRLQTSAPLVECFEHCELLRGRGLVRDFAVAPTTLETIFLRALTVGSGRATATDHDPRAALPWAQRG